MKTFLPAAVVILFASVPAAQAAPYGVSHVDQHATAGVNQARQLRAEIASRFVVSRDYQRLVHEADDLVQSMDAIHDAVHSGRSRSTLRSLVDHAQAHVRNLDRMIGRSDYLSSTPGYRQMTPTGYISSPPSRHPGSFHVDATQRMLAGLATNLRELETDLQPTIRFDRRPFIYGSAPYRGW